MEKEGIEKLIGNYLKPYSVSLENCDNELYVREIKDNLFGSVLYSENRLSFGEKCGRLRAYLDRIKREKRYHRDYGFLRHMHSYNGSSFFRRGRHLRHYFPARR